MKYRAGYTLLTKAGTKIYSNIVGNTKSEIKSRLENMIATEDGQVIEINMGFVRSEDIAAIIGIKIEEYRSDDNFDDESEE